MSRGDVILRLVDVTRIYTTKEEHRIVALDKVTTSFKRGEFIAIVGKSGSGKSTLINILGGLDIPDSGDYFLEGNNISNINEEHWDAIRNEKIGFIFQEYHLINYLSVYKNVEIALKYQNKSQKSSTDAQIKDILDKLGLKDHMYKNPLQLSGGQRQRVAVARALVKDPDIILADEPTGALDRKTGENVIELIKGLSKDRLVLVVTHDRGIANEHATRIIEIEEGKFTTDLVKEDIEQTFQNVYRKIKPTNLSFKDKLELTWRKISSRKLRTFFTALSLALAFCFTIIFNGLDRGVTEAYDNYYNSLNMTNSFAFTFMPDEDVSNYSDYTDASSNLLSTFNSYYFGEPPEIVSGLSRDVAVRNVGVNSNGVEHVFYDGKSPDLLQDSKVRLLDLVSDSSYEFDDLFIEGSEYPVSNDELLVTSEFFRTYFNVPSDITDLNVYLTKAEYNNTMNIPLYTYSVDNVLIDVDEYLKTIGEDELGNLVYDPTNAGILDGSLEPVRFVKLNIPTYCGDYDTLDGYYQGVCDDIFEDNQYARYFKDKDEYIEYITNFEDTLSNIETDEYFDGDVTSYFDLVQRSGFLYYIIDEREGEEGYTIPNNQTYIERVYRSVFEAIEDGDKGVNIREGIVMSTSDTTLFNVTGIIHNENESIMYLDKDAYNSLFTTDEEVTNITGYYTVNLLTEINEDYDPEIIAQDYFVSPLNSVQDIYSENYTIYRTEIIEIGDQCSIYELDNVLVDSGGVETIPLMGDVFVVSDYSECKVESDAYRYLTSISLLLSIFFNFLIIVSVIFFNMLLQVILGERLGEIGVYRCVGSTSKDIKVLFFYEIIITILMGVVLSYILIVGIDYLINYVFFSVVSTNSNVFSFAGLNLSLVNDKHITNISIVNLVFYVFVMLVSLIYLSNRNISKIANTKPIDIIREVE